MSLYIKEKVEVLRNFEIGATKSIRDLPQLGLDDTFEFKCKACGKCCRHREDVILTPYDLFRIAGYLGKSPKEIFERYCRMYEGQTSRLPVVRIVPVAPSNSCPFLRDRRCIVHTQKPVVCRVYPLARVFEPDGSAAKFIYSGASCKHEPRTITVREWIGDVASEEAENSGRLWSGIVTELSERIRPESLDISKDTRSKVLNIIFWTLYLNYDIKKPFYTQLEENFNALTRLIDAALEAESNDLS